MNPNVKPLLSILIPVFKYPEGLVRILHGLNLTNADQYEVLISDNSDDDSIEEVIEEWRTKSKFNITYLRNIPSVGPAANWNKLIDSAKGKFSLLMHHDEFPIESDFLSQLCDKIEASPETDIFILDCILVDPKSGKNRRHIPSFIKRLLLRGSPVYLYRRNYIGPTATVVCKTKSYPRFDERLIWLVDVDLYVRILLKNRKYMYLPNIKIGSLLGRDDSITAKISNSVSEIKKREISYLTNDFGLKGKWFDTGLFSKVIRLMEFVCWGLMRGVVKIFALIANQSAVSKILIFRAINPFDNK